MHKTRRKKEKKLHETCDGSKNLGVSFVQFGPPPVFARAKFLRPPPPPDQNPGRATTQKEVRGSNNNNKHKIPSILINTCRERKTTQLPIKTLHRAEGKKKKITTPIKSPHTMVLIPGMPSKDFFVKEAANDPPRGLTGGRDAVSPNGAGFCHPSGLFVCLFVVVC